MKKGLKLFIAILVIVFSLNFLFTAKSHAEYPPNYTVVTTVINGQTVKTVYAPDGGVVEIIIDNND